MFGLYFYCEDVDVFVMVFVGEIIEFEGLVDKFWGMYEFVFNGFDEIFVRIGWLIWFRFGLKGI